MCSENKIHTRKTMKEELKELKEELNNNCGNEKGNSGIIYSRNIEMKLRRNIIFLEDNKGILEKDLKKAKKRIHFLENLVTLKNYKIKKLKLKNKSLSNYFRYYVNYFRIAKSKYHKLSYKQKLVVPSVLRTRVPNRFRAPVHIFKFPNVKNKQRSQKWCQIKLDVINFFNKDENSSNAPGVRDYKTKNKIKRRIRYLNDTIRNLYKKFCSESEYKISKSLFYKLKPFYIVKKKVYQRDTNVCKSHSEFEFLLDRLHYHKLVSTKSVKQFLSSICCDITRKECMFRECDACRNLCIPFVESATQTWHYSWAAVIEEGFNSKNEYIKGRANRRQEIVCTVSELINKANDLIPKIAKHVFTTTNQYKKIENMKQNLKKNEAFFVIDFSQNYNCKYWEETQGVQFGPSRKQVSLQTGGYYIKNEEDKVVFFSIASVSDCLLHNSAAIWALLLPPINKLLSENPQIDTIHFQSDGPYTRYKNKSSFFLFKYHCKKLGLKSATWNFTASGHGKSVADGIGGNVKKMCDEYVACGNDVWSAADIIKVVRQKDSLTSVFLITETEIMEQQITLPSKLISVPKTSLVHQIFWHSSNENTLSFSYLTCTDCISKPSCEHYDIKKIKLVRKNKKNTVSKKSSKKSNKTIKNNKTTKNKKIQKAQGKKKDKKDSMPQANDIELQKELVWSINSFNIDEWLVVIYDQIWYPGKVI